MSTTAHIKLDLMYLSETLQPPTKYEKVPDTWRDSFAMFAQIGRANHVSPATVSDAHRSKFGPEPRIIEFKSLFQKQYVVLVKIEMDSKRYGPKQMVRQSLPYKYH